MDERDERKRTSGDASKRFKTASELELHYCSRKSVAETYLLATRCPVYRRHDSHLGSCMELENLSGDAKGISAAAPSAPSRRPATAKREAVSPAESRAGRVGSTAFRIPAAEAPALCPQSAGAAATDDPW